MVSVVEVSGAPSADHDDYDYVVDDADDDDDDDYGDDNEMMLVLVLFGSNDGQWGRVINCLFSPFEPITHLHKILYGWRESIYLICANIFFCY